MIIGQRIYTRFENGYDQGSNEVKLSPNAINIWDKVVENSTEGDYGYSFYHKNGTGVYTKKDMTTDTRESVILHSYIFEDCQLLYENMGKLFSVDKFMESHEDDYPLFNSESFFALKDFCYDREEIKNIDFDILSALCLQAVTQKTALMVKCEGSYNLKKGILARLYNKFPLFLRELISFSTYENSLDTKIQFISDLKGNEKLFFNCESGEHTFVQEKYIKRFLHIKEHEKLYQKFISTECENKFLDADILNSVIEKADIETGVVNPFEDAVSNLKKYLCAYKHRDSFYLELIKRLTADAESKGELSSLYGIFEKLIGEYKKGKLQSDEDKELIRCIAKYTVSYVLNKGFIEISSYSMLFDFIVRCIHSSLKNCSEKKIPELINIIFEKEFKELYKLTPDMFEFLACKDCDINGALKLVREKDEELYYIIERDISLNHPKKIEKFYIDVLLCGAENSDDILKIKNDCLNLNFKESVVFLKALSEKYSEFVFEEFTVTDEFTAMEGWEKVKAFTEDTGISPYDIPVASRFLDKVFLEFNEPLYWDKNKWLYTEDDEFYSRLIDSVVLDEKSRDIIKLIKSVKEGIPLRETGTDYTGLLFGTVTSGASGGEKRDKKYCLNKKERGKLLSLVTEAAKLKDSETPDFDLQLIVNFKNKDIKRNGLNIKDTQKINRYLEESLEKTENSALSYDPIYTALYGYFHKKSKKRAGVQYKEAAEKLYGFSKENKSRFTVFKMDNIKYGTCFTRLYMLMLIVLFAVLAAVLRSFTASEYIKGCIDTASFMLSGITVFIFCCYGKGGILKRRIDTGLNVALFVSVWFIFICILQFIL